MARTRQLCGAMRGYLRRSSVLPLVGRVVMSALAILVAIATLGAVTIDTASAATTVETNAVNWAIGQIGSTTYGNLCLTLVNDAYQDGAGFNIEPLTNYGSFNSGTYPQEIWDDGFKSGTTGGSSTTPPYGALVFFNASGAGASDPADYSHITIMGSGGEMISSNDVLGENVHYETLAAVAAAHPYNTYVGWWLPDGNASQGSSGTFADGSFVSYQGNIYRIAGGAPLYINDCDVGCPQSIPTLTTSQWDQLPQIPADGTTLGSDNGGIYKVGGGAPLYINSCDVGCGTPVDVTQYTIDNNGDAPGDTVPHLLTVPVDGTTLVSDDNSQIYKVAGGATLLLSDCDPGCGTPVEVTQYTIDNNGDAPGDTVPHLNSVPADGTVVEGLPSDAYWLFTAGSMSSTQITPNAVVVDDTSVASFLKSPPPQTPETPSVPLIGILAGAILASAYALRTRRAKRTPRDSTATPVM